MSERPVAEIIGWERHERDTAWHSDGSVAFTSVWFTPPGVTVVDAYGCWPTVDDLLAWLTEHHTGDYVYGPDDTPGGHFVFAIWDDSIPQFSLDGEPRGWQVEVRHSPTLLEALEQAVRKIDEYDNPPTTEGTP